MINQQLVDFIKKQLQQGSTKEKITSELLANDWTTEDIEEGFNAIIPVSNLPSIDQYTPTAPIANIQTQQIKYAGFWTRFVANFIDGLVIIVLALIVGLVLGVIFVTIKVPKEIAVMLGGIFGGLSVWVYFIFMTYKYQATYGKKLVGIRVISTKVENLTLGKIILRETIGKIISAIILYIGYIMVGFTEKKQALHDKIADTIVVHNDPNKKMPKWIIITIVLIVFVVPFVFGVVSSVVLGVLNKNINPINKTAQTIEQNSLPNPYVDKENSFSFSYPKTVTLLNIDPTTKDKNKLTFYYPFFDIEVLGQKTNMKMILGSMVIGEQSYQDFIQKMKNTETLNNISEEVVEKNGITWNIALIKDTDGFPAMKRIMTQKDNLNYGLFLLYTPLEAGDEDPKYNTEQNKEIFKKWSEEGHKILEETAVTFIDTFEFTDIKQ